MGRYYSDRNFANFRRLFQSKAADKKAPKSFKLRLETLEDRRLLSATPIEDALDQWDVVALASTPLVDDGGGELVEIPVEAVADTPSLGEGETPLITTGTTYQVTKFGDGDNGSGTSGSLRYCIRVASSGDTIKFTGNASINLGSAIPIEKAITIDANGYSVTLNGQGANRVFNINYAKTSSRAKLVGLKIINGGSADLTYGGGIWIHNTGGVEINNCEISGCKAKSGAGIYYNATNGTGTSVQETVLITQCKIMNNTATSGNGGGICVGNNAGKIRIGSTAIYANSATGSGGGVYQPYAACPTDIFNCTIVKNNVGGTGGGVFITASSTNQLKNTIITNNTKGTSTDDIGGGPSLTYCLSSFPTATYGTSLSGNNIRYNANFPLFANLSQNNFALALNSQAVNFGDGNASNLNIPDKDLAGNDRVYGGTIDIGAYESQIAQLATPTNFSIVVNSDTSITVKFSNVSNATGYYLQCSTASDFSSIKWSKNVSANETINNSSSYQITAYSQYYFRLKATNASVHDSEWATKSALTLASTPSIAVKSKTSNSVTFTIGNSTGVRSTNGYCIEYDTIANPSATSTHSWKAWDVAGECEISGLNPATTYYFQVVAYDPNGRRSVPSANVAVTTMLATPSFSLESKTDTSVTFTVDSVNGAAISDGYCIEYAVVPNPGEQDNDHHQWQFGNAGERTITGLTPATTYYFQVFARSSSNSSARTSGDYSVKTNLAAPSVGIGGKTDTSVTLSIGSVISATGYVVRYATSLADLETAEILPANLGEKTISGLDPATTYYFQVRATSSGYDESAWTLASATTNLAKPSLFVKTKTTDSITLLIGTVDNADGYVLEYSNNRSFNNDPNFNNDNDPESFNPDADWVETVSPSEDDWTSEGWIIADRKFEEERFYYFRFKATANDFDDSAWSEVEVKTNKSLDAPLIETVSSTRNSIAISILDNPLNTDRVQNYKLQYSTDPTFNTFVTETTFPEDGAKTIENLNPATLYYFRVLATSKEPGFADSGWSRSAQLATRLETPTFDFQSKTSNSATLKINDVGKATSYTVGYKETDATEWTWTTFSNPNVRAIYNLSPATNYEFKVQANAEGMRESEWSDILETTTNLAVPTLAVKTENGAKVKSSNSITLSIGEVSSATGYTVEYSKNDDFSASSTQTFGESDVPTITGLTPATAYYFRVKATSTDYDESEWSSDLFESTNFATPSLAINAGTSSSITITINSGVGAGETGASVYTVDYSTDPNFDQSLASVTSRDYSVGERLIEGLDSATRYYFRVKAKEEAIGDVQYGESENSAPVAATTNLETTTMSVKRSETDDKIKTDSSITFAIKSVPCARSYAVEYADNPGFNFPMIATITVNDVPPERVDATITGLAPATIYYFRVKATADGIPESEWSVVVSETTNPSTPTLSVKTWDSSSATISIGEVGGEVRYEVQYSTDATFSDNYTTRIYKSSGDKTIEDLKSATTYYFRVRATLGENENSEKSEWSDSDSATINLAVPSLVVKARGANSAAVVVGYSASAESYVLQYGTDPNFDSYLTKEFGSSGYQILSDLPSAATTYYFRVKAKATGFQDSDWSTVENETTNLATPSLHVRTAPSGNTPYTTTLTIGNVEKAEIYELQYATDYFDAYGVSIATKTFAKSGDVTIDDLDPMSVYFFRVRAVSAQTAQGEDGEQSDETVQEIYYDDSDWSTTVYAVTGLATPSFGFQPVGDSAVTIVIDPVEGAEKYEILKSQDPEFDEYEVSKIRTLSKTYYGLEPDATYYFRVRALAPAGGSQNAPLPNDELVLGNSELILEDTHVEGDYKFGDSAPNEGTYHNAKDALPVPSGLSVDWSATTADSITLTIDDYYPDSSRQFVVQYSEGDAFASDFTTELPAASDSRITIAGLNPGTTYFFRAKVKVGAKTSDWYPSINDTNYYSFRVSETTLRALTAPTVSVAKTTANSATLNISSVLGAEKYEVEYGTDSTFATNVAKETFRTNGGRTISGLIPGTTYYFRVRATASDSEPSAWTTAPNSFKTGLQTPTLSVVASNSNSATLAIQAVNGADKYVLEYGKTKNFSGATSIEYSSAGSKTISGLEVGKTYYFRVRAESTQYGVSAKSKAATAKTVETPRIARVLSEPNALTVELADLASASEFVFEYGTDPSFKTLDSSRTYAKSELSDGQISVDRLASGTRYYLRVRAKLDGEDVIADSAWSTFEAATSLETPTLTVEPVTSNSVLVDLGYVYSATSYALEYGTSASFAPGSTRTATFSSAGERAIYGLSPATTYYFRVKASAPGFGETTSDVVSATSSPLDDASRLTVSSTADDASVPGTLRYALANANDGETIVFASNLQGATITLTGGELVVDKAITIDASALWSDDAPGVAISASQTPGEESRVFNLTADATLIGLRIANGLATNAGNDVADTVGANSSVYLSVAAGGGVLVGSGTRASLVDCVVENNRAVASPDRGISFAKGAGICAYGDLTLENCVVVGNKSLTEPGATSAYAFGGGVGSGSQSVVTIRASKIMENQTSAQSNGVAYSFGAGLYASGDASILDGSLVHKNKAKFGPEDESSIAPNPSVPYAYGGGAYAVKSLNVGNSQFTENVALQRGGAIYVNSGASVVVSDGSVFSENNSGSFGGGIFSEGDLFVNGGTSLTKNRSEAGGAIYSVGKLTMTDSVVNENTAECASTATGGGLHLSGAANLQNVAITENQAKAIQPNGFVTAYGGGVYVGDASVGPRYGTSAVTSVSLVNCSVVGNRVESSSDYYGATSQGGGVYATPNGANFQATNCEISGNETVSASLSEVWGAKAQGGGFYGKSAILVNATIVDNATTAEGASAAAQGNGAYFYGTQSQDDRSNVYNSVIARNGTADDNDVFKDLGAWVGAYEVLSPFKGWSYSENLYEYSSTTPLFENYAEKDYRPAGNGQLVDRGVDSYCDEKIDRDLSGKTRVVNKAIDLGAYEFSGDALAEPSFALERVDGAVRVAIDKPVDGADLYRIEYGDRPSFEGAATKEIVGLTDDLALVPGSTVYVRVRAEGGDYFASNWTSRKYCADDEFASAKSSPVGGVVEIKEVENADKYLLEYGLDPNFKDAASIEAEPGANYLAGLIAQELYHVRVQALDASGESVVRWTVASFKTDSGRDAYEPNDSRSAATDLGTVYGAKSLDALNLHSANDEDWFFFAIGSTPGDSCFAKIEFANSLTADLDLELFDPSGNLVGASRGTTGVEKVSLQGLPEGDYALRVFNRAANGTAVDYKLSINAPSEGAADVPVAKIATDPETGLALIGFDSISLEIESTAGYVLEYSTDPNFGSATRVEGASSGALTISDLTPETTYYFHIANANETNPDWFVFEATTEAIPVTQLDAPAISSISTTKSAVTFRLAAVANATNYLVEYSTDSSFATSSSKTYSNGGSKTISGLLSGTTYYFRAKATADGCDDSAWTTFEATTTKETLAAPSLTPGSIGINSIDVAIGEVANATSYVLEYSKSANFASKTTKTYSSAGSRTITGLDADTTYYFRVKATAERFNESAWSTTLSATTLNPSATPLETPNIAALSGTKTAIVIKLDAVEGAQKYVVEYATDASFSDAVAKPYSSAGSKTISGLTTGTWYFVRVKATATGRADSPYTATRKIYTGGSYSMPAASFSAVKSSITLNIKAGKIDASQGAPEKYVIEYSENPDFSNAKTRTVTQGLNDDGTLKPCKPTISSLTFGTKYYIRVKAIGAAGNDSPWNSTSYTAGQLAVPSRFASSVGSDFVNVKCYNVTGMAGFEVMYSTSSDFSNPQYAQGPASGTVAVTGLQSSTKYYFKARALGDNVSRVNSAWSPSFSATTKEAVSSAVLDDDSSFENFFDEQDELDAFWDVLAKSIAR